MGRAGDFLNHVLIRVIVFVHRIARFFHNTHTLHHARFAGVHELTGLLTTELTGTSLLLGISHFNQLLRVQPTNTRRELGNLLVVAPTRGGKGLLATAQLLTWPHSVVINDIKGELFDQTAGYRATLGKVFVIDPTSRGHRFDPLQGKQTEDALLSSATQLLFKPDETDGAIFTQRATIMLTQLFLAARHETQAPLPYIRSLIRQGLPDAAARLHAITPDLATQFLDVQFETANFSDRFLLSAWSTLTARLRPLLTETVIRTLSGADVQPQDLLRGDKPITVYLRWPEQDLLALSPLVRLVWGSLIDELVTAYDTAQGNGCKPVLLLIDEAGRTAIPSLADHATTVVGRGISLWIAVQSLAQLDAVYGKTRATVLRDNMESQLFYRPSNQETADYLEHCLGRKSDYAHSQTKREGTETSQGLAEQSIPLMTSQDIKLLKDEQIIGFVQLHPPFMATRMDWRRFPQLVKRRHMPPPALSPLPALVETLPTVPPPNTGYPDGFLNPDMEELAPS